MIPNTWQELEEELAQIKQECQLLQAQIRLLSLGLPDRLPKDGWDSFSPYQLMDYARIRDQTDPLSNRKRSIELQQDLYERLIEMREKHPGEPLIMLRARL